MQEKESLFVDSMTLLGDALDRSMSETELANALHELDDRISDIKRQLFTLAKEREKISEALSSLMASDEIPPPLMDNPQRSFDSDIEVAEYLLELFSPRLDVYAERGRSASKKGIGYYPVCRNRWNSAVCPIAQKLQTGSYCSQCPNRDRVRLTAEIVYEKNLCNYKDQCMGAVGIYPLKDGNVTRFVAIDLDASTWHRDARTILRVARKLGIAMVWERSSSGNGAHLWVFFSEDVPAASARKLAFVILDKAREENPGIPISSYDRLFPSQDTLSPGGIGNLILLPFVSGAVDRGNTLFLDEDGEPYDPKQQIAYLSALHKHSRLEVETFIASHMKEYLDKADFKLTLEEMNPSWVRKVPSLDSSDITGELVLYLSTGISFDKNVLSKKAQEALRRFATISNPEYYRRLAKLDGRVFDCLSRIPLYEENDRVIKIPRGYHDAIIRFFQASGIAYTIEDHRSRSGALDAHLEVELWPRQKEALDRLLESDTGILAAATGFGKTMVALAMIEARRERTLVIVPSDVLMGQWAETIQEHLRIGKIEGITTKTGRKREVPGLLGSGKDRLSGIVDIATIQTLTTRISRGKADFLQQYGLVIVDECHRAAAPNYRKVLPSFSPTYVLGISATVKRGGLEKIVYGECGQEMFSYDPAQLARDRGIAQYYHTKALDTSIPDPEISRSFNQILDLISSDRDRSDRIACDVADAYAQGRKILVFTRRLEQNRLLAKDIEGKGVPCITMDGKMGTGEKSEIIESLRSDSRPPVLIATEKLLGEGVDIPHLDTLFLAAPFAQERILKQCAGRLARAAEGKTEVHIFDYLDYKIPRLSHMFTRRVPKFRKMGYIMTDDMRAPQIRILHFIETFVQPLISDIASATSSVVLSAKYVLPSRDTLAILDALVEAGKRGISIELRGEVQKVEGPMAAAIEKMLLERGLAFRAVPRPKNYVTIDGRLSWYGGFSILGKSSHLSDDMKGASIIRIVDETAAKAFLDDDENLI